MKWLIFRLKGYADDIWARLEGSEIVFDCTDSQNDWIADCDFSKFCNIELKGEKVKIYDCEGNLITEGILIGIEEDY